MNPILKPRIIGLTASPSRNHNNQKIQNDINVISSLIEGRVCMPVKYEQDLANMTNLSSFNFIPTSPQSNEPQFVRSINNLFQMFLVELVPVPSRYNLEFKPHIIDEFRALFTRITQEPDIQAKNRRRFILADFFHSIINSLEIMTVIGVEAAAKQISDSIHKLVGFEPSKNRFWEMNDYKKFESFDRNIDTLKGESEKYKKLIEILTSSINTSKITGNL